MRSPGSRSTPAGPWPRTCWSTPCGGPTRPTPSPTRCRRSWRGCGGRSAPGVVATVPGGYRLTVDRQDVDALRFESLVAAARGLDPAQARPLLVEATALWRGPALADVRRLPFGEPAAVRLEELRAVAVELSAEAALRLGEPDAELDALEALLAAEPLRESAAAVLARCLHATGRQVEALAVLDRTRDRLADELGVDPGPTISAARLAVLRGAPVVDRAPAPLTSFVGRTADVRRVTALLATGRLVTLTGPGGAGKTRLAREVVRVRRGETRIAELAPLGGADQLAAAVLAAVSTAEIVSRIPDEADTTTRLLAALAAASCCSCWTTASTSSTPPRVSCRRCWSACPGLRILATSREPLAVPGEVLHPVDALRGRRRRAAVRRTRRRRRARVRRDGRAPSRPSSRSAAASTGSPCRSSWPPPACAPWLPRRSAAGSTTGSGCSPPARGPHCRATRRCAPSSTGAGTCSTTRSARSPGGCPSSRAVRPRRPRCASCGLGDATLDAADGAGREVAAGGGAGRPDALPDAGDDPRVRRAAPGRGR